MQNKQNQQNATVECNKQTKKNATKNLTTTATKKINNMQKPYV